MLRKVRTLQRFCNHFLPNLQQCLVLALPIAQDLAGCCVPGICVNYQYQSTDCQHCTVTKCFKCLCERCPANPGPICRHFVPTCQDRTSARLCCGKREIIAERDSLLVGSSGERGRVIRQETWSNSGVLRGTLICGLLSKYTAKYPQLLSLTDLVRHCWAREEGSCYCPVTTAPLFTLVHSLAVHPREREHTHTVRIN